MADQDPTLDDVIKLILNEKALENKDLILNVYIFGSRLYGYATNQSDWDFVIIVDGEYFAGPKLIEKGLLNLNLYHRDYFQFLMDENVIWIIMFTWIPNEFVWQRKLNFSWKLRKNCVNKMISLDVQHNFSKAKRLWKNPKTMLVAKKNLLHCKRWIEYGKQIGEKGIIFDFSAEERIRFNEVWFFVFLYFAFVFLCFCVLYLYGLYLLIIIIFVF
jgi:predicted nucleotidyltransferase